MTNSPDDAMAPSGLFLIHAPAAMLSMPAKGAAAMKTPFDDEASKTLAPADDGGADHLDGKNLPSLTLPATDGRLVDLSKLAGITIVFVYPKAGRAGTPVPEGWATIPGASGCTSQTCAFRDQFAQLKMLGVENVFGLSTLATVDQHETVAKLHLPFPLLSDPHFQLADALRLPAFTGPGVRLLRRLTMIIEDGRIVHVLYPVAEPERNPQDVIAWLKADAR